MRFASLAFGLAIALGFALPAQAQIHFEDNFNGASGTVLNGRSPDTGAAYSVGDEVTLDGSGRAVFQGVGNHNGVSIRSFTAVPMPQVGEKLLATVELSRLTAGVPIGVGEINMQIAGGGSNGNSVVMPALGNDTGSPKDTGNYSTGWWHEPPGPPHHNQRTDSGVAMAADGESHEITTEYNNSGSNITIDYVLRINGGPRTSIGTTLELDYSEFNGLHASSPGELGFINFSARGVDGSGNPTHEREASFTSDYLRFETVPVPEPATAAMFAIGGLLIAARRRRC